MDVRPGECVYLAGPSGSGKTTLLSILGCILSPDRGQLQILGKDLQALGPEGKIELRRDRLGFMFQRFQLIRGLTALENVCVPLALRGVTSRVARIRGMALLDAVGLTNKAAVHPAQLSAGQCQRVALARALVGDPQLILADEPTASLDAHNGLEIMELLRRLIAEEGKTAVVVTHDQRIFRFADRILWLDDGQLAESSASDVPSVSLPSAFMPPRPFAGPPPIALGRHIAMRKRVLWSCTAVLASVLVSAGFVTDPASQLHANRPEEPLLQHSIFAAGRIEGASTEIGLRPELTGRIAELLVREGQFVEAGAVLLRLDDRQYQQEVALAEAELALTQAQLDRLVNGAHKQQRAEADALCKAKLAELERTELDWQRTQSLLKSRVVSQQEADNQRTLVASVTKEAEAAKARLELLNAPARADEIRIDQVHIQAAQARLELARVQLDHTQLRAPRSGQILKADVELGELAGPNSAEPIIVMADTSSFRVRAHVEELDAPRVQIGMKAVVTADGMPGEQLYGRVIRLSPRMGHKEMSSDRPNERFDTKTREVWVSLEPGPSLVVGLRVDVMIDANLPAEAKPVGSQSGPAQTATSK
jgi:ABC-type lipoprotein export system ATPase subunit/multidrug resistance efflux pump